PEVYGPELYDEKCQRVFEHIYASYFDNATNVYTAEAVKEPPPVIPVGAVSSAPDQVTEDLIHTARSDPNVFARLMEEMFGAQDTWFRPTEALLADEENRSVEYKQTARWSVKDGKKDKAIEQAIVKTVAGFLNSRGGTLLIGVRDDRQPVGLDADYALVKPPNTDGYVGWLDTMLESALGHAGAHRVDIRIDVINGQDVCRIDVPASSRPVWVKTTDNELVLYERRNNSTRAIPADEVG